MRLVLLGAFLAVVPHEGRAQAARIGRLPLLDSLSARVACESTAPTPFLRETGTARLLMVTDSGTGRSISLGIGTDRRPTTLLVMMGTRDNRRGESETLTASFFRDKVVHGDRSAFTTGTPSRLNEDRQSRLLPSDTTRILRFTREVLRHCRVT